MKKNVHYFYLWLLILNLASCSLISHSNYSLKKENHLKMKSAPIVGQTITGQNLYLGGFSGLMLQTAFNPSKDQLIFSTITDRGPNGYQEGAERPFLLPDYAPRIIKLSANLSDNSLIATETLTLKKKNILPLTGLPNSRSEENPVDIYGHMLPLDSDGLDTEGLVSDDEGGYWIGEEYGPSLAHFDSKGKLLRRLTPYNELPKLYIERIPNRGFEGIAKNKNKLFGFLQSPLPVDNNLTRIVEIDLDSLKTVNEYFYLIDSDKDRIGDAVSIGNNKFLVIEQNGKAGKNSKKAVYKITLDGADKPVKKELLIDLQKTAFNNLEKVEGITIIDNHRIALINDNDFQIDGKSNRETGLTPLNNKQNEMLILEFAQDLFK